ncbi:MAG: HNH endonuclease [Legionella sp.]|uniref:HNH endonuclease n=1 Tax=Legionella sp. TaxID=459 RepID=UPI00284FFC7F|nr:HNH endonuclease [Legionella sp.]
MKRNNLDIQTLNELFICDPIKGLLFWKFRSEKFKTWNTRYAGHIAGYETPSNYIIVTVCKKHYYAHRIIWAITYGYWPDVDIDHKDGIGTHNWIGNLREATVAENGQNQTLHCNNTSGYTGVTYDKCTNKWRSIIQVNKQIHQLGYFDNPEDGYKAYLEAKGKLHKFQPIPR